MPLDGPCPPDRPLVLPSSGGGNRARPSGRSGASAARPRPTGRPGHSAQSSARGRRAHAADTARGGMAGRRWAKGTGLGSPPHARASPAAATQKCRRAKKLTPTSPPPPSPSTPPPPSLPPSFPGPARRRRRGRCFFFKAAPPSPGSAPLQAELVRAGRAQLPAARAAGRGIRTAARGLRTNIPL